MAAKDGALSSTFDMLPAGLWHCPNCTCKFCGADSRNPAEDSERTVNEFLSCSLCDKKYHESCSLEMNGSPAISNNPSATFCGHKCQSSRLNFRGFYTAILERGDDITSAASIRICGTQLVEMPFIGTWNIYRHEGMCRRLFSAIETGGISAPLPTYPMFLYVHATAIVTFLVVHIKEFIGGESMQVASCFSGLVLSTIKVEKLIIPAISEHLHIWTKVFRFHELEESNKQEMKSINMLVFPGTDLLQKKILKKDMQEACELQHSHLPSPALVEKADQESSIRRDGHSHDGVCLNIAGKNDDRFGPMDSDSRASAVHLSDNIVVRAQVGCCESDTQIFSKEVDKNFAESATKRMLSCPSGASNGSSNTEDAALHPAEINVNSGIEPISQKV